ncbi:MAG TPA: hypothetical protein ENG32_02030, partial [bacterium]|nr:hypothetical protein [bacterium]
MFKSFLVQRIANFVKNKTELSDNDVKIITNIFKVFPVPFTIRKGKDEKENKKIQINSIRESFLRKKGWIYGVSQRILKEWHPNCKEKFIKNLVFGGWERKSKLREKIKKEGSFTPTTVLISPLMRCNYH